MSWFEWRDAPAGDYAVLGDSISHSLSPLIHSAAYVALALPLTYRAIRVSSGELAQALERLAELGYRGVNVTAPLKEEAGAWAGEPDEAVRQTGCANTLDLQTGRATNTDMGGFLSLLESANVRPPATVLLLGAGGAARGVGLAMAGDGYNLRVYNRTFSKAASLAESVGGISVPIADPSECAVVVNATSSPDDVGVLWERAEQRAVAVDLRYGIEPTEFVARARSHGMPAFDGRQMLLEQAALAFEWWMGREAPREVMRKALYEALETDR